MSTTLHKHDCENCMLTKAHSMHIILVQVINALNMCCLPPILTISQLSSQIPRCPLCVLSHCSIDIYTASHCLNDTLFDVFIHNASN